MECQWLMAGDGL